MFTGKGLLELSYCGLELVEGLFVLGLLENCWALAWGDCLVQFACVQAAALF